MNVESECECGYCTLGRHTVCASPNTMSPYYWGEPVVFPLLQREQLEKGSAKPCVFLH